MKNYRELLAAANLLVDICLNGKSLAQPTSMAGSQRAEGTLRVSEANIFVSPAEKVCLHITPAKEDIVSITPNREVLTVLTEKQELPYKELFQQMLELLLVGWALDGSVTGFTELFQHLSKVQGQLAKSDAPYGKELSRMFGQLITHDGQRRKAWSSFKKAYRDARKDEETQKKTYALFCKVQKEVLGF